MQPIIRFLAILSLLALAFQPVRPAQAAGQVVGDGDADQCTYADLAAALSGGGLITFNCGPNPLTIILTAAGGMAPPAGATTIDGGGLITLSAANVDGRRHFNVGASAALTLTHLTLINASLSTAGGGSIQNFGRLVLDDVTLRDNSALNGWGGGAIANKGVSLLVRNSRFQTNTSSGGGALYNDPGKRAIIENTQFISNTTNGIYGGAITNQGILTVTASSFTGNRLILVTCPVDVGYICGGGAIMNYGGGALVIDQTLFDHNTSDYWGGAILNLGALTASASTFSANLSWSRGGAIASQVTPAAGQAGAGGRLSAVTDGSAVLTGLTVVGNHAIFGGGLYAGMGVLAVSDSTVAGNAANGDGGGVWALEATAYFTQTTFSGNTAQDGGGVYASQGIIHLTHVTFSGNQATDAFGLGGGLTNDIYDAAYLRHVTFSDNTSGYQGAALTNSATGTVLQLTNVLFANNRLTNGLAQNCAGQAPDVATFNLTTDTTCLPTGGNNRLNVPALLGPLADNGGPTLTHLPAPGSEPIDHGTCLGGLTIDQRGLPRLVGGGCDIGAVERQNDDAGWYSFLPGMLR